MTPDKSKDLGKRALKLGMPWIEGLMDGHAKWRLVSVEDAGLLYSLHSWPDFRDPLTEAWLVAWGLGHLGPRGWDIDETPPRHNEGKWRIYGGHAYGEIDVYAETRAEAWILALEKKEADNAS